MESTARCWPFPHAHVVDSVRACAEKGIGGLIVLAGGFAEAGEQGRSAPAADRSHRHRFRRGSAGGTQLPGYDQLCRWRAPLMLETAPFDALGDRKGVAVVSQSGAMASAVRVALQARGIGVSYSVSTGNEASLGAEDFLEEFIADPHTRVIAMLMEQIRRPARFLELATLARKAGKFIVLHHLGRSTAGREAAKTHTGALSGDYAIMAAQVVARGVCLVDSLELLIDVPELLIRLKNVRSPGGTAIVAESGAFKGMALDFCEAVGLDLPRLSAATQGALAGELPVFSPPSNPLDLTAQALVDPDLYRRVLDVIARDAAFGSVVITISLPSADSADRKLPRIIDALSSLDGNQAVVFAMLGEDCPIPAAYVERIRNTGTPFFRSPERAFRALAALKGLARQPAAIAPAVGSVAVATRGDVGCRARRCRRRARAGGRSRVPREGIARGPRFEDAAEPPRGVVGGCVGGRRGARISAGVEGTVEPSAPQIGGRSGCPRHSRWRLVTVGVGLDAGPVGC